MLNLDIHMLDEVVEPNTFSIQAVVVAFTKREAWLEELRRYISKGCQYRAAGQDVLQGENFRLR